MIGAIVGDIVGSRFEWHNRKSKQFAFMKGAKESRHPYVIRAQAESFLDPFLLETLNKFEKEFLTR